MSRPSRFAKRLLLPVLCVAGLLALAQVVLATAPTASLNFNGVTSTNPVGGGCQTLSFTDTSSDIDAGDAVESISWDFGDGTTQAGAPGETVSHPYATPGDYAVTVTATDGPTDPDGVQSSTSLPTAVSVTSPIPFATITSVSQNPVEPNEQFTLTGSVTDDGSFTGQWDLDGNMATIEATGLSVPHAFATSGPKTVRFRAVDNCGQTGNFDSETVVVSNGAPIVSPLVASAQVALRGQAITVSATATDPGGGITLFEWDVNGDGDFADSTDQSGPTLTQIGTSFATSGNHKINLRVSDDSTPARTTTVSVDVWVNFPPQADFAVNPSPPLIGDAVRFQVTRAEDSDGTITKYEWDLDGNGSFDHEGPTPPAQSYGTAGARSVTLRVTDDNGEQSVVPKTFIVGSNIRPEASFRVSPGTPGIGEEVTFTSTSDDADDRITKHEWDFNLDGRFDDQGRVVSRTFRAAGKRTVTLRVTDSRGATAITTETFQVRAKTLKAPVDVKRSLGYIRESWGIRLVILVVKVPAKTTVSVTCKGQGCPKGKFTKRSRKNAAQLRFTKLQGSVRAGAKITVVTKRAGHVPAYDVYTVRGGNQRPRLREGCKPPGAKKARALGACD
jgi:large repetitive protein